ncbi:alpha-amylase family glycosyl hydrolase, partial [Mediterraneibacter gnavus]|uniref:alpha-amylase family glycosyl hydrolase n=1 Tax=Mediterraneibacter gnavus TaxID=33038 RepID=UPI0021F6A213
HDCMTISEAYGVSYDELGIYIGENGCFDSMFDFNYSNFDIGDNEEWFIRKDWTAKQFRDLLFTSQVEVNKVGWVGTFLENHDQPRSLD